MQKYLRPNTLFAPSHFDDYLNEAKEYLNHANRPKTTSDGQRKGKTPEEMAQKKLTDEINLLEETSKSSVNLFC